MIIDQQHFKSTTFFHSNICVTSAHSLPKDTSVCRPYVKSNTGYCSRFLGNQLVFGGELYQQIQERKLEHFSMVKAAVNWSGLLSLSRRCLDIIDEIYCFYYFPRCDMTSSLPMAQPVCIEACDEISRRYCPQEWELLTNDSLKIQRRNKTKTFELIECKKLPRRNGGTVPECYYPDVLLQGTGSCRLSQ